MTKKVECKNADQLSCQFLAFLNGSIAILSPGPCLIAGHNIEDSERQLIVQCHMTVKNSCFGT